MAHPHSDAAHEYASSVVSGQQPACKWVRLACQRHLDDMEASRDEGSEFYFDPQAADRACNFIQAFPHVKGKWARNSESITLEPWQCFAVCSIFGWKRRRDDLRRFRRAEIFVPRKNGKSLLGGGVGLYMFAADGEYGSEVYSGATTEKQAWEVFRPAKAMANKVSHFREYFGVDVNASNLSKTEDGSRFEPVIGTPGDGSSPHCAIVDEYHEHKTDEMVDTMETGMGAREQPLLLMITTAGSNMAGPCYEMQVDAQKMLEGVYDDEQTFALIYTVDQDDDWASIEAMEKANPNLGVSVNRDFLEAKLAEAKNNSRKQSTYQTKHLNVWVGARDAYFNVQRWRDNEVDASLKDYEGQVAYIGLDLASKVDIAALEVVLPNGNGGYARFGKYYLPEETIQSGENEHYAGWLKDGWVTPTDGEIIDFNQIKGDILDLCSRFEVAEVAYDPHQATMLVTELMDEGVPVVEMRPTVLNFSEPMKELDALIRSGNLVHNGDPVMTWMVSNVVAKLDAKDNVYPRKERQEDKIDGVVANIMALNRAINGEQVSVSPWEDPSFTMMG